MATIIGSARHDENGKYSGGKVGDNTQKNTPDFAGEVSMQYLKDFVGSRKWYIIRAKSDNHAHQLAEAMNIACNNANIGYDQSNRLGVMTYGVDSKVKTEADCSSLVRACIKKAVGLSVANFTTANEKSVLLATGLFNAYSYSTGSKVYEGDIFVTQTKGHTGICVQGISRKQYLIDGLDYSLVFNPTYYVQRYSDLKAAYGNDADKLFEHFKVFGMKEGRQAIDSFNVAVYKARYIDLQETFGDNLKLYYKHYIEFGYSEGRQAI